MTGIWWWRSGMQKHAAKTRIITHLKVKPISSLAWHVWVIATIKALIEVWISRNKAGSCQRAAEKKLWYVTSSRPPFRVLSFKTAANLFFFPLWCRKKNVRTSSWKASVGLLGWARRLFFFPGEFAGRFSGMDKELKQQKSACGRPRLMQPEATSRQREKTDGGVECFITVRM